MLHMHAGAGSQIPFRTNALCHQDSNTQNPTFYRHFHHLTGPTYFCQKTKPGSILLNLGPFFLAAPLNSSTQLKQDYPTLFLESKPSGMMIRVLSWQDFAHSSLL